jgi:hypothetical protein
MSKTVRRQVARSIETLLNWSLFIRVRFFSSKSKLVFPKFVCIGAQKAGTTWLMNNLMAHPDVYLPDLKPHFDTHFFDIHLNKGLSFYSKYFEKSGNKISGENTPAYGIMADWRIKLMKYLMPELKIIFLVRDQKDRAISHAKMNLKEQFDKVPDTDWVKHFRSLKSQRRGDYLTILRKWRKQYRANQIYIGDYDRIKAEPKKMLMEIFNFIGLKTDVDWNNFPYTEKFNVNPEIELPKSVREELIKIYPLTHSEILKEIQLELQKD